MAKRALCVGINDYPYPDSELRGCVNDARAWAELLTSRFDFPSADIRTLTDSEASKKAIMAGLERLLKGAVKGDVLVFTNASHGTYLLDRSGADERYDEALCPHDITKNLILDDELRGLFAAVPLGVQLVVLLDNCHSGSGTRQIPPPPPTRRARFLDPRRRGGEVFRDEMDRPSSDGEDQYPESGMRELLLSGCMAHESSSDDQFDGVYHGAMTYHAIRVIRDAGDTLTYHELHTRLLERLRLAGYDQQHPMLEGTDDNKRRQLFV